MRRAGNRSEKTVIAPDVPSDPFDVVITLDGENVIIGWGQDGPADGWLIRLYAGAWGDPVLQFGPDISLIQGYDYSIEGLGFGSQIGVTVQAFISSNPSTEVQSNVITL